LSELINSAELAKALKDGRCPCSTDADMFGVNAAAPQGAPPVPVAGGEHTASP